MLRLFSNMTFVQYLTAVPPTTREGYYSQYNWVRERSQVQNLDVTWNLRIQKKKKKKDKKFF